MSGCAGNGVDTHDILASTFLQEEISTVFALLGDANMNFAACLADQGCRMIYVRHEHCAVAPAYGSEIHKLRAEGRSDGGATFSSTDFAAIARGFGIRGETITDLKRLPGHIEAFRESGDAAVWNVPVSDRVVSPVIRRAHPPKAEAGS